jgi:hypothetical protein
MQTPDELRNVLTELKTILRLDESVDRSDELWLQVADISIAIDAISASAEGKRDGTVEWKAIKLGCAATQVQLADLVMDILAYYGLPLDTEGMNEPSIGRPEARQLRSRYLEALARDEIELMRLRDDLAEFMLDIVTINEEE